MACIGAFPPPAATRADPPGLGRRAALSALLAAGLAGCVAPTGGGQAPDPWSVYRLGGDPNVVFLAARAEPAAPDRGLIRRARSIAIVPSGDGTDAAVVAVAQRETTLQVVPAATVARWVRANRIDFEFLPVPQQVPTMARLGRAVGADLVILVEAKGTAPSPPPSAMMLTAAPSIDYLFETTLVATAPRRAVWQERHGVRADTSVAVTLEQLTDLLAVGISRRVMELRGP
jgi:hypothetical protein